MSNKQIKWGTIIPLIGGSTVGCYQATGTKPAFHLSFNGFQGNDIGIRNYWAEVPYLTIDDEEVKNAIDGGEYDELFEGVDFVNSVCPCAALARLNTSRNPEQSGANAVQNDWLYKSAEFVMSKIRPRVYWGENAPALATSKGRPVAERLAKIGLKYGYTFSLYKTDTLYHGIPQKRNRSFFFFWRQDEGMNNVNPILPYYDNPYTKGVAEFLKQIPADASWQDKVYNQDEVITENPVYAWVLNKLGLTHKEFVEKYDRVTLLGIIQKNGWVDEIIKYLEELGYEERSGHNKTMLGCLKYAKMKWNDNKGIFDNIYMFNNSYISAVMSKNIYQMVHPTEPRHFSIRELMTLMGLPMDFEPIIESNGKSSYSKIGQNVPVCTARDMAIGVVKYLDGELEHENYNFIVQDNNSSHKVIEKYNLGEDTTEETELECECSE